MIPQILPFFIGISLVTFLLTLFIPKSSERSISTMAIGGVGVNFLLFLVLFFFWAKAGFVSIEQTGITLYSSEGYTFALDFYFDTLSAVFFAVTCLMTLVIMMFSKFYMHRDQGFKRFYNTVLIFFIGLTLIIFAGTFEMLFVGWEFIGISSFLLIAFYRDRFLPAKNALKVFTLYRIADAFLLLSLWVAHHVFEKNIHFSEFHELIIHHGNQLIVLGALFFVVALIKSAQFPFSYWLPRAMEGPTTSSAIFYGALSVHMGLFVLFRTFPLWEGSVGLRTLIVVVGIVSAVVATCITRVQSSIKTQIAYASITQISIMFIELGLGLQWLVLAHFVSNALLRTYQLLISPSIVSYLVNDQFYHFILPVQKIQDTLVGKIRATVYIMSIKEWSMDTFFSVFIWKPFKALGRKLNFMDRSFIRIFFFIFFCVMGYLTHVFPLDEHILLMVAGGIAIISFLFYVRAFSTKSSGLECWHQIFIGHLYGILFLSLFSKGDWEHLWMYLIGIVVAYILGFGIIRYLEIKKENDDLAEFHGHMYEHGVLGNIFFLVSLSFMAFPITPSFLGQEILLSHIHTEHVFLIFLFALGYVLSGVSILRLYAKVFFGPHKKTYHEIAYKSS